MCKEVKVAVIGLDTSHTIEFTRRMQALDCPEDQKVLGMKVVRCMRFSTPFTDEAKLEVSKSEKISRLTGFV